MRKCSCILILCQLLLGLFLLFPAGAEEDNTRPKKKPLRSIAIKPTTMTSPNYLPINTPSAPSATVRNGTTVSGMMVAQEINRQRLELSNHWSLEGDYNYYTGWFNRDQWLMLDKPEIYAVYHFYPFESLSPYFRFGADWLREKNYYFRTSTNRNGDTVGLHAGGGLRFGFTKHMVLDFDMRYSVSPGTNKNRGDSWGGSMGVLFYF